MLNSSILDVVLGLVFSFLGVSLVASALVEAVSSLGNLRARSLVGAVMRLVNDPTFKGLALRLYQHAAVNPGGVLTAAALQQNPRAVDLSGRPAYIAPRQFAAALMDVTGISAVAARDYASASEALVALEPAFTTLRADNPQLADLLAGLVLRAKGQLDAVEAGIAAWFDASMDRLGGPYKRWTQLGAFTVALLVAAALNIDAVRIGRVLWEQPSLAQTLQVPPEVKQAMENRGAPPATPSAPADAAAPPADAAPVPDAGLAEAILAQLDRHLPIGWPEPSFHARVWQEWPLKILGWLIPAIASLFGAPFWFDALQAITRLKGSGPSPSERRTGKTASA